MRTKVEWTNLTGICRNGRLVTVSTKWSYTASVLQRHGFSWNNKGKCWVSTDAKAIGIARTIACL